MVVDVLRATTVMATALAAGAERVLTCREVDQARALRDELEARTGVRALLVGERRGLPIEGFDLGNSPADYTAARVSGRTLIQSTTNGTKAVEVSLSAKRLITASFVNLSAVARSLLNEEHVSIICAGTDGKITGEDLLLAGALIYRCAELSFEASAASTRVVEACELKRFALSRCLGDEAISTVNACYGATEQMRYGNGSLVEVLLNTQGGRNLTRLGLQRDVADAAAIDRVDAVPECVDRNPATFAIRK